MSTRDLQLSGIGVSGTSSMRVALQIHSAVLLEGHWHAVLKSILT